VNEIMSENCTVGKRDWNYWEVHFEFVRSLYWKVKKVKKRRK